MCLYFTRWIKESFPPTGIVCLGHAHQPCHWSCIGPSGDSRVLGWRGWRGLHPTKMPRTYDSNMTFNEQKLSPFFCTPIILQLLFFFFCLRTKNWHLQSQKCLVYIKGIFRSMGDLKVWLPTKTSGSFVRWAQRFAPSPWQNSYPIAFRCNGCGLGLVPMFQWKNSQGYDAPLYTFNHFWMNRKLISCLAIFHV